MTDDLYAEKYDAKVFNLEPESGNVTFGVGLRGARPPRGAVIQATYEYGGGLDGKVAIGAINKASALPGGVKVSNTVNTWGASPNETAADGEQRISSFLKHKDRLVTVEDFREITLRTPGVDIGRVEVLPLFHPTGTNGEGDSQEAGSVTVMVIPEHDIAQPEPPDPTRLFLQAVVDWLEPRRLVTTQVYVRGPVFIPIVVSLGIVTMPGQSLFVVQKNVKDAIRRYLSSLIGGPEITNGDGQKVGVGWPLLNALRPQDLMAAASRVEGVRYVSEAFLGAIADDGTIGDKKQLDLKGIQLPWLSAVDVQEGTAAPITNFAHPEAAGDFKAGQPVPLLPRKC
jgi:predicted phage baseplate assembly protein